MLYLNFYVCNMCCIFLFCKDNAFTIDFEIVRKKYFQQYIVISISCFILLCTSISVVVCVFHLLFIFRA